MPNLRFAFWQFLEQLPLSAWTFFMRKVMCSRVYATPNKAQEELFTESFHLAMMYMEIMKTNVFCRSQRKKVTDV